MKRDIFETMQEDIMGAGIDESTRRKMLKNVMRLKEQKIKYYGYGSHRMWKELHHKCFV